MEINEIMRQILATKKNQQPLRRGSAFAPVNIALAKYWGKKNNKLNLPVSDSISIALPEKGSFTEISVTDHPHDVVILNGKVLPFESNFYQRLTKFLNQLRAVVNNYFEIKIYSNIPIGAGLASSACGYASLVLALNDLFRWQLNSRELSILARLGSGSAARSLWPGFVHWVSGDDPNGMDSFAQPINATWPDLRIGLLLASSKEKAVSSREAMERSRTTSPYFSAWTEQNQLIIDNLIAAIKQQDFSVLGPIVERNALAMHATMLSAYPPILYADEFTVSAMHKIWQARGHGLELYFTQDAGPNLKLLFLEKDLSSVQKLFPNLDLIIPFKFQQQQDEVTLVAQDDRAIGTFDKILAHKKALCHRAISVFIFRETAGKKELLLQQRHSKKIHSANLWTNTCCSHPIPGEDIFTAGERRLQQEMGMNLRLFPRGVFHYTAQFDNGMTENEVDHVLVGYDEGAAIHPAEDEVQNYKWIEISALKEDLAHNPKNYTPWFARAFEIACSENYHDNLHLDGNG